VIRQIRIRDFKYVEKMSPTHRSRDMAHAQWLQLHCQWYPTGDVIAHNPRTDSLRVFKLCERVDHMIRHVWPLTKVRGQGHTVTKRINSRHAMTGQRMVVLTSNLVDIFVVRYGTRDTLSRSVDQLYGK